MVSATVIDKIQPKGSHTVKDVLDILSNKYSKTKREKFNKVSDNMFKLRTESPDSA